MEKCLVTKLKGSVDGNLLKIGEFSIGISRLDYPTSDTQKMYFNFDEDTKLHIVGDGYFTDSALIQNLGKEIVIKKSDQTPVYVSNGDYEIFVGNKYGLTVLGLNSGWSKIYNKTINIEDFQYSNIAYLLCNGIKIIGDFKKLDFKNVYSVNINSCDNSTLSTSLFTGSSKLSSIIASGSELQGDIANFANCINLENMDLGILCYGSVESLCQSMYNAGRTSGTLDIKGKNLTYNNAALLSTSVSATFTSSGVSYTQE